MDEGLAPEQDLWLGPEPGRVDELVVIRPGGLGELVRALPALAHLRRTYPAARITIVASEGVEEIIAACPYIDRFVAIERPSEALVERFDVAISFAAPAECPQLVVDDVSATFRVAWGNDEVSSACSLRPRWPERLDARSRMLRLAWLLGGELTGEEPSGLWPSLADRNGAAQLVRSIARPIAVVHLGADQPERLWRDDGWTAVLRSLDVAGVLPVAVGEARDAGVAAAVAAEAGVAIRNVAGRISLGELVALIERSIIFIGTDSGPAALAGAAGVPSIVIGPSNELDHVARPGRVDLVYAGPCSACHEPSCVHGRGAAAEVPLERVLARLQLATATAVARWRASRIA